jgi:GntR family transcriptional repressor for pyruvate dehydrogenase complex
LKNIWNKSLVEQAVERILDLISERDLEVGDKLPTETELSEILGVGRSTVREAVSRLGNHGVLTVRQGKGTFLNRVTATTLLSGQDPIYRLVDLNRNELQDVMDVRKILEVEVVRRVARRITDNDLAELREYHEKHVEAKNSSLAYTLDIDFHMALARFSGNSVLPQILSLLRNLLNRYTDVVSSTLELPAYAEKILEQHRQILVALEERDEEQAAQAMLRHLTTSQFTVLANYDIFIEQRKLRSRNGSL